MKMCIRDSLCPGFVDIHMHGQKGLDSMRPGDNGRMAETQVKYGVTSFCPASITETDEAIRAYLADIRAAMELERGARVLGAYLEGPYLAAVSYTHLDVYKRQTMETGLSEGQVI